MKIQMTIRMATKVLEEERKLEECKSFEDSRRALFIQAMEDAHKTGSYWFIHLNRVGANYLLSRLPIYRTVWLQNSRIGDGRIWTRWANLATKLERSIIHDLSIYPSEVGNYLVELSKEDITLLQNSAQGFSITDPVYVLIRDIIRQVRDQGYEPELKDIV